ncbi:ABC transporter permease [Domibacillus robiginosus]|uniref:ABC transporter permease n=1 Tax=Domibacillus robiginosus TaxID=1071054 RepID=UPI00067C093B|nr:ABC transporter permease subunit [Domibacillus robiginosus]
MKHSVYLSNKSLLAGVGFLLLIGLAGFLAPWLAPHDPLLINLSNRLAPPSWSYPFGTDHLGRCILSRVLFGSRISALFALFIVVCTFVISLPIGLFTGYVRGRGDHFFMRLIDGTLAIPDIVLTIAIVGVLGPGLIHMTLAIVLVRWAGYVRFIRSLVRNASQTDYILSARMSGNNHVRIMRRYILPKVFPPLLVYGALDTGKVVLLMAGLSFLGLGTQPPAPEWGVMLHDAVAYFQVAPHTIIFPGLAIMLFVSACQLIGEAQNKSQLIAGKRIA